jgi:hypothetical protein
MFATDSSFLVFLSDSIWLEWDAENDRFEEPLVRHEPFFALFLNKRRNDNNSDRNATPYLDYIKPLGFRFNLQF